MTIINNMITTSKFSRITQKYFMKFYYIILKDKVSHIMSFTSAKKQIK